MKKRHTAWNYQAFCWIVHCTTTAWSVRGLTVMMLFVFKPRPQLEIARGIHSHSLHQSGSGPQWPTLPPFPDFSSQQFKTPMWRIGNNNEGTFTLKKYGIHQYKIDSTFNSHYWILSVCNVNSVHVVFLTSMTVAFFSHIIGIASGSSLRCQVNV